MSFRLPSARISRDSILFFGGLLGLAYQTISVAAEKPALIAAFVAMTGLPVVIRGDEKRKAAAEKDEVDKADALAATVDRLIAAAAQAAIGKESKGVAP